MSPYRKQYSAEILSINEERSYYAHSVDAAAELAAEEFGEDDVGRVYEVRSIAHEQR